MSFSTRLQAIRTGSLKERATLNASWLLSSSVTTAGLTAVKALILARFLGAAAYGELGVIIATVAVLNQLVDFRSIETIIKYVNLFVDKKELGKATAVIKTTLLIDTTASLIAFALLMLATPFIADTLNAAPQLLQLYGLTILASIPTGIAKGLQSVRRRHDWVAWQEFAVAISQFVGTLVLLLLDYGLAELVLLLVITEAGKGLVSGWFIYKSATALALPKWSEAPLSRLQNERQELTQLLLSTNLVGLLKGLQRNIDTLFVSYWLGPAVTGNYRLARNFANMLNFPIAPLYQVAYTEFAKLWHRNRVRRLYRITRKLVATSLVVAIGGITAVWFVLPLIFNTIVGDSYTETVTILRLLIIGAGVAIVTQYGHALLIIMKKSREAAKAYTLGVAAQFIFLITLTPLMGATGAGIAYLMFAFIHGLTLFHAVWPQLKQGQQANEAPTTLSSISS
ncbi:MAG: oligosaccharide flippase family protein [Chloroflexota bacterium]